MPLLDVDIQFRIVAFQKILKNQISYFSQNIEDAISIQAASKITWQQVTDKPTFCGFNKFVITPFVISQTFNELLNFFMHHNYYGWRLYRPAGLHNFLRQGHLSGSLSLKFEVIAQFIENNILFLFISIWTTTQFRSCYDHNFVWLWNLDNWHSQLTKVDVRHHWYIICATLSSYVIEFCWLMKSQLYGHIF